MLASTNIAYAQISKASKKIVKANAKQFEKEGWSLDGTGTFNSVLTYNRQNEKSIIAKRKVAILPEKSQNEK